MYVYNNKQKASKPKLKIMVSHKLGNKVTKMISEFQSDWRIIFQYTTETSDVEQIILHKKKS